MKNYVVIDLEMCRVPKMLRPKDTNLYDEIIQIGAVRIDPSMQIADSFSSFVHPRYGLIDEFIENLTGIRPAMVEDAPDLEKALEAFLNWLPENSVILSWSGTDKEQIQKELPIKGIELPGLEDCFENWEDCQLLFSDKIGAKKKIYKLSEALRIADIDFDEHEHDGLADAHNTALLFIKMQTEKDLKLSKHYQAEKKKESVSTSLGDLFAKLDLSSFE